jgi:cell division transport system ATP-binding protein
MRYGFGPEVLRDITFDLPRGSFHYLAGPSGAGKSSLLKLLYLAMRPSRGVIHLFNHDVSAAPRHLLPGLRRRIGVVFQNFRLLDHLSAFDNVALPLRIAGASEANLQQNVTELLAWVGLGDRLHARPASLSGGEQQRVAIARAVIARPELLLADEPTGSVDPDMGARLMHLFLELNKLGTTVLIATHDERLIAALPYPVLRLRGGELAFEGKPGEGKPGEGKPAAMRAQR